MKHYNILGFALLIAGSPALADTHVPAQPSFEADVLPILAEHCLECHQPGGEGYDKSGVDFRTHEGVMKGTNHGPIIVPGKASLSNLMLMIEGQVAPEIRMPHGQESIEKAKRNIIRRWINQGAKDN